MNNKDHPLLDQFISYLPLIPLYAELHYRFKFFPFSRYFTRDPEIIFDAPWRCNPDQTPTLYLLIKDADKFPIHVDSIRIKWETDSRKSGEQIIPIQSDISTHWHFQAIPMEAPVDRPAKLSILPEIKYQRWGKSRSHKIAVHNGRGLSRRPLQMTLAQDPLPAYSDWFQGDMHLHTALTEDQVEFGAPLPMTQAAATQLGLDFLTPTDHSYDLDDDPNNYLKNDPELRKWRTSRQEISDLNHENKDRTLLIPGEEITVRNGKGKNVHFLHYNDEQFYPGKGDGAESWFQTKSENSVENILSQRNKTSISIASHPKYRVPPLQRLLIGRDEWHMEDLLQPGLEGAQILSGTPHSDDFEWSRQQWVKALLGGARLAIIGGSDAHGNFNRFRQVDLPMWSLHEHDDQLLGQARTLIYSRERSIPELMEGIRNHRTAATTGPVGTLTIDIRDSTGIGIGDTLEFSGDGTIGIEGKSSQEFGLITDAKLIRGYFAGQTEEIIWSITGEGPIGYEFSLDREIEFSGEGYIRLEIESMGNGRWPGIFLSSPIWYKPSAD